MLSDPVHATAAKAEPRSSTGQSQSFSRLFHSCAFNGFHTLTFIIYLLFIILHYSIFLLEILEKLINIDFILTQ